MFRLCNSHHQANVEHWLGTYNVRTSAHIVCTYDGLMMAVVQPKHVAM
jgi:hypothetical protein